MRRLPAVGVALCLGMWLCIACRSPQTALGTGTSPTITLTPAHTRTPTPGLLGDAEAAALIEKEVAARGVAPRTLKIRVGGEPRWASIRYASSYDVDGRAFEPQSVLIALAVARVVVRVRPPIDGGIRLSVMPVGASTSAGGEGDVGLRVTIIDGSSLKAWADGSISDQEFVSEWTVGIVTRE